MQPRAFTLIELLVVITIIVVLLALLTPALDKALYQAELTMCGTQLKGIVTGGTTYAMSYQRHYPDTGQGWGENPQQQWIGTGDGTAPHDRRKVLALALGSLNKTLNDPLTGDALDLERSTAKYVASSYNFWFAWTYTGHRAMKRVGDRFGWTEKSAAGPETRQRTSNIVASDRDEIARPSEAQSSHPDADGILSLVRKQDEPNPWDDATTAGPTGNTVTMSLWLSRATASRGETDSNFGAADGSVLRVDGIHWNEDDRLARAPIFPNPNSYYPNYFHYLLD